MGTVTYPHESVARELAERFVPCKLESGKSPEVARKMNVRWLPGLVVADADERPTHTIIGFLPPDDLLTELAFGRAVFAMGAKRYEEAHELFRKVAETPGALRAPEAYYWWGISRYRQSKELQPSIQDTWGRIREKWPDSQWARRVGYAFGQPAKVE